MDELLYQFLIQHKKLSLPGVGSLMVLRKPAESDFVNKLILPPSFSLQFDKSHDTPSKKLFTWLAGLLNCTEDEAIKKVNDFCIDFKESINLHKQVQWNEVGTFYEGDNGRINFEPSAKKLIFEKEVVAEKVMRTNAQHTMRVGELEKTSSEMTALLSHHEKIKKSNWWVWPLVLSIVLITFIGWYFSSHGLQTSSSGLQQKVKITPASPTYVPLK